jgi:phosphatidate cytidylyltransferase
MLKQRLLTALILLPIFSAALFFLPDPLWAGFLSIGIIGGLIEWAKLAGFSKNSLFIYIASSCILIVLLFAIIYCQSNLTPFSLYIYITTLVFWSIVAPLWMHFKWQVNSVVYGVIGWIVMLPTWLAFIDLRSHGAFFLLTLLGTVWIADSAAYFSGRKFGKHKLAPLISPKKTWEGVVGAFITITIYGFILVNFNLTESFLDKIAFPKLGLVILVAWGITIFSIIGDLFESMIKRQYGAKDSGNIFPGHGGVLDRIDSLTATMPILALGLMVLKI